MDLKIVSVSLVLRIQGISKCKPLSAEAVFGISVIAVLVIVIADAGEATRR